MKKYAISIGLLRRARASAIQEMKNLKRSFPNLSHSDIPDRFRGSSAVEDLNASK